MFPTSRKTVPPRRGPTSVMPSVTRNVVMIAIAQVAVIVVTILGAAAAWRLATVREWGVPGLTLHVAVFGGFALFLPVAWTAVCLLVLRRARSDWVRAAAYWSGPVLLAWLLVLAWSAAGQPILAGLLGADSTPAP